jgi:hypothetical protein
MGAPVASARRLVATTAAALLVAGVLWALRVKPQTA